MATSNPKGIVYLTQLSGSLDKYRIQYSESGKTPKTGKKNKPVRITTVESTDSRQLAQYIITMFDTRFKSDTDAGYLKGNQDEILACFNQLVNTYISQPAHTESSNLADDCIECQGTGRSYWSDGIRGVCMSCGCMNCEKNDVFVLNVGTVIH